MENNEIVWFSGTSLIELSRVMTIKSKSEVGSVVHQLNTIKMLQSNGHFSLPASFFFLSNPS